MSKISKGKLIWLIIGALVGAFANGAVDTWRNYNQVRQNRLSLKSAFAGEISAILEISKGLNLPRDVHSYIKEFDRQNVRLRPLSFTVKEDYFRIYKNNVTNLGILDASLVEDICTFYTYCFATVEYLNELSDPKWVTSVKDKQEALQDIDHLLLLLKTVEERGKKLKDNLEK